MTATERAPYARSIKSVLCETMPDAAIASGFLSPVDHKPLIAAIMAEHRPEQMRGKDGSLSLPVVVAYLKAHDLPHGEEFAKKLRIELMRTAMREAADKLHAERELKQMLGVLVN